MIKNKTDLTIITPCFNEMENVEYCAKAVKDMMKNDLKSVKYEHIFIDNCSTDSTYSLLTKLAKSDRRIKVISNSRNVGSVNNVWIGMQNATGRFVLPSLCADLQDPVNVIPAMYKNVSSGLCLISNGVISDKDENYFKFLLRRIYYKLIAFFAEYKIPINSTEFLVADGRVVDSILKTDNYYPYIRGMFAQSGAKSIPVYYSKEKRKHGKSKENYRTYLNLAINGFISTSTKLPRYIFLFGLLTSFIAFIFGFYNVISFLLNQQSNINRGVPSIIVFLLFFNGAQLLFIGIIAEYVQSIHRQVRRFPESIIMKKINFSK